ncbi:MAG: hypothetical protein Q7Q73_01810 [Verrucomicrobiota bacterium JB024]|nr:hypothetical protein [Verrucomicrobiota bacterium JB024]
MSAIASSAEAAITYHLTPGVSGAYFRFNPITGETNTSNITSDTQYPIGAGFCGSQLLVDVQGFDNSTVHLGLLNESDVVDGNLSFTTNNYFISFAPYTTDSTYYIGFRFEQQGTGNDETYYGYFEVLSSSSFGTGQLVGYAIGGDNESVPVQPVPEPATIAYGLGALAMVGYLLFKRFRLKRRG